ncbi:tetratricopeptide repeat protein [Paraburkholderia sp.]|jgi:mxaK protein|uniref:tetratricopeptide repeat protein n=1 Tax=Paraburkholderia sp. TaxID=1926495 RepID=UPI002F423E56
MRRVPVHLIFGTVALCCAALSVYDYSRLMHAQNVNLAVASIAATGDTSASPRADDAPQVRLARATAFAKAGNYAAAGKRYEELIGEGRLDSLRRTAVFDLGNMYLRQGIGDGNSGAVRSIALIEEAKERYRVVLRADPDDWDARYNLERALWLAPESGSAPLRPDMATWNNIKLHEPDPRNLP